MLQANVQVEASAPVVLLLLEYFESIKHAYVNFASGTVDYRPPLIIRNLNYRLGNFSENLLYSMRIKGHTSLDAHTV